MIKEDWDKIELIYEEWEFSKSNLLLETASKVLYLTPEEVLVEFNKRTNSNLQKSGW